MLDNSTQTSILDWLDLRPELLSATQRVSPASGKPAAPAMSDSAGTSATISIDVHSLISGRSDMVFYQPEPMSPLPIWGVTTHAYHAPGNGGTQAHALAEMAGYLTTRLAPRDA